MLLEGTRLGRLGDGGGCPVLGYVAPLPEQEAGARPCREKPVGAETVALESSGLRAAVQPALHLLSQLISCPALGAWPLLGASSEDFLPLGETNPHILLLQARASLPGQLPSWGIAQQGSARQPVSHWRPGHLSPLVSLRPQDPATTLLCIGTNLSWERCHRQG